MTNRRRRNRRAAPMCSIPVAGNWPFNAPACLLRSARLWRNPRRPRRRHRLQQPARGRPRVDSRPSSRRVADRFSSSPCARRRRPGPWQQRLAEAVICAPRGEQTTIRAVQAFFRRPRVLRSLMAAFLPYVAATLIFDALHLHAFVRDHGPLCRHHISEPPPPVRASSGYECPTCSWQRNLPQQAARTWSPDLVRSSKPVSSSPRSSGAPAKTSSPRSSAVLRSSRPSHHP